MFLLSAGSSFIASSPSSSSGLGGVRGDSPRPICTPISRGRPSVSAKGLVVPGAFSERLTGECPTADPRLHRVPPLPRSFREDAPALFPFAQDPGHVTSSVTRCGYFLALWTLAFAWLVAGVAESGFAVVARMSCTWRRGRPVPGLRFFCSLLYPAQCVFRYSGPWGPWFVKSPNLQYTRVEHSSRTAAVDSLPVTTGRLG